MKVVSEAEQFDERLPLFLHEHALTNCTTIPGTCIKKGYGAILISFGL